MGVLLSFLLVFKSNLSFNQYWEARSHVGDMMRAMRAVCIQAMSYIRDTEPVLAKDKLMESAALFDQYTVTRLLKLYYFLVMVHLRETGPLGQDLPITKAETDELQRLRQVVMDLATSSELHMIIAAETDTPYARFRPFLVVQWIMDCLATAAEEGRLKESRLRAMDDQMSALIAAFNGVDKIDKMQFPFPYAQLVKVVLLVYVFTLPIVLHSKLGVIGTPIACALFAFGFYGVDEVGEMLEDPFGHDDNDLPLFEMGKGLVKDLDEALNQRCTRSASVWTERHEQGRARFEHFCSNERTKLSSTDVVKGPFEWPEIPVPHISGQGRSLSPPQSRKSHEGLTGPGIASSNPLCTARSHMASESSYTNLAILADELGIRETAIVN